MILVTGTSGQVGHALAHALAQQSQLGPYTLLAGRQDLDLSDLIAVRKKLRELKPNVIINPAAYTAVDKAESEPQAASRMNTELPAVLAEEAYKTGALLIHYSTDYVFDGSGNTPWLEDAAPAPMSIYGKSKLEGEQAIAQTACDAIILRTQWVFSEFGNNFLKTMLRLGAERPQLRIVADQVGSPTSAAFLARMTLAALIQTQNRAQRVGKLGTYHLACSGFCSWYDFASAIFTQTRQQYPETFLQVHTVEPIKSIDYPTPARRPYNSRLNCEKFKTAFHLNTLQTWQDALAETLSLHQQKPDLKKL